MPFHLGPLELGIVLLLMLMVFGVGKLPSVARHLGEGLREFRKSTLQTDTEKEEVNSYSKT